MGYGYGLEFYSSLSGRNDPNPSNFEEDFGKVLVFVWMEGR